jgi:hypothetical protein
LVEWEMARKTEVLGEILPQHHFVHHKSYTTWRWMEVVSLLWEAGLSYVTATGLKELFS